MKKPLLKWLVPAAIAIQVFSLILLVGVTYIDFFGRSVFQISLKMHEAIEIAAVIGLLVGLPLSLVSARILLARNTKVEEQLRVASGDFHGMLIEHFKEWSLSPSEIDVAMFAMKGLSNNEIAELRGTSDGTVKAQLNAVYKKAGLESRTQLLGFFIEELMVKEP